MILSWSIMLLRFIHACLFIVCFILSTCSISPYECLIKEKRVIDSNFQQLWIKLFKHLPTSFYVSINFHFFNKGKITGSTIAKFYGKLILHFKINFQCLLWTILHYQQQCMLLMLHILSATDSNSSSHCYSF